MKIESHSCYDGYDRPDYSTIEKISFGTLAQRVALARQLLMDGHTSIRPFDNCFEQWDGAAVIISLAREAKEDFFLADRMREMHDGEGTAWLDYETKYRHIRNLKAFAVSITVQRQRESAESLAGQLELLAV